MLLLVSSLATAQEPPVLIQSLPPLIFDHPLPPPRLWTGGVEFGFNGSEGNSDNFRTRWGGNVKRETQDWIFKTDGIYSIANANSIRSENRGLLNSRFELLKPKSPWSLFFSNTLEADEFKAYDLRVAPHAGLGYTWLKNDTSLLKNRLGAGGSWELGGPNNDFMPEALVGLEIEHKLTGRSRIVSAFDYFPDFRAFHEYRTEAKVHYEVLIDPEWNLTLKLGILDRYDSTPEGKKPNDLDYFGVLLWKF